MEEKQGDRNEDRERDKLNTHMYVQNEKKRALKKNWSAETGLAQW